MKAQEIEQLLTEKHYKDFVCPQCKLGGSWGFAWDQSYFEWLKIPGNPVTKRLFLKSKRSSNKWENLKTKPNLLNYIVRGLIKLNTGLMDVWVMRKSWTDNRVICYEIKVNRGDFFNDHKWPIYLDFCNEFYFAVPNGMLKDEEIKKLPAQAGVIEVNKKGTGMRIRKKPHLMLAPISDEVFRYILMWRAKCIRGKR
jgi:hypothetical protein